MTRRGEAGFTYVELIVVAAILGVLLGFGVPRATVAFEEARVDEAVGTLASIWNAQRMHWLEEGTYAADLDDLVDMEVLETRLGDSTGPFTYDVVSASATDFTAEATRINSSWWSGTLVVDETGVVTGTISNGAGRDVEPPAP